MDPRSATVRRHTRPCSEVLGLGGALQEHLRQLVLVEVSADEDYLGQLDLVRPPRLLGRRELDLVVHPLLVTCIIISKFIFMLQYDTNW